MRSWELVQVLVMGVNLFFTMATFVVFTKIDYVVAVLAWGPFRSSWGHDPLDESDVELLRRAAKRTRFLALVALAGVSFSCGALMMLARFFGQLAR